MMADDVILIYIAGDGWSSSQTFVAIALKLKKVNDKKFVVIVHCAFFNDGTTF